MEFTRTERRIQPLNMIPLINVVFLLLVFFLLAGRISEPDPVVVTYPEASSGTLLEESEIVLTLGADQSIHLNSEPIAQETLEQSMTAILIREPDAIVTLKADASVGASQMIGALQAIRRAGGQNVSLVTERRRS